MVIGLLALGGCKKPDHDEPAPTPAATITISGSDDANKDYAKNITAPGPDGDLARKNALEVTNTDLKASLPSMIKTCINGTFYIVMDGQSPTVTISPLFENGSSHPTACEGGTILKVDGVQSVEHIKR